MTSFGQTMAMSVTAPLTIAGIALVKNASAWDDLRNKLQAATGSTAAANDKFKELFNLAQQNVGVMTDFAVELYAMLKPMKLSEASITGLIKSFGRIKLQQPSLDIKQFSRNLQQMFTTFDRQDFKEAFEQFPRFGEIVAEKFALSGSDIASVQSGLKELKASGKLTYEEFINGFNEAIANDPSLGNLQETIGTRFAKAFERVSLAFEPLGKAIANALTPIVNSVVPMIEKLGAAFSTLSPSMQTAIVAFAAVAAAAGPVLIVIGSIASAIGALVSAGPVIGIVAAAVAGLALPFAAVMVSITSLRTMWDTNFGGIRDITQKVAQAISTAWDAMKAQVTALTAELMTQLKTFWDQNGEDIKQAVTTVSETIKTIWQAVLAFWTQHGEKIKTVTSAVWEAIKGIIKGSLNIVLGIVQTVAALINGDWSALWEAMKTVMTGALQVIVTIVNGQMQLLFGVIKTVLESIWNLNAWVYQKAYELGANLGRGLVDGIKAKVADVKSAAGLLADAASGVLALKWIIQSPSKLFQYYGEMAGQGIIEGLNSMKDQVQESIESLTGTDGLINAIQGIGDVFGQAVANWDGTAKGFFKSLAQGFKQLVQQILAEIVRLMVVKAIMSLIGSAVGGIGGGSVSSAAKPAGSFIGGMWASGGFVSGPGSSTSDSIPAMLSNGEYVINAKSVRQWGRGFFENLNAMSPQMAFAGGGFVGGMGSSTTYNSSANYSPNVVINVSGSASPEQAKQTGNMFKREILGALERERMRNK